ncbi:unnamed protein product [Dicrocoelium dendriticum]|nr:unnamed protein product [Dicrocoelium dendriticum]
MSVRIYRKYYQEIAGRNPMSTVQPGVPRTVTGPMSAHLVDSNCQVFSSSGPPKMIGPKVNSFKNVHHKPAGGNCSEDTDERSDLTSLQKSPVLQIVALLLYTINPLAFCSFRSCS